MAYGFVYLFWGFLLVIFDFRINGFNLIPDFIGFLLITIGLTQLEEAHSNFAKAKGLAIALVVISLPEIVEFSVPIQPGNPTIMIDLLWPIILIGNVVTVVMTWLVLKGIIDLAQMVGPKHLARETPNILNLYLGVEIFGLSFGFTFNLFGAMLLSFLPFAVLFPLLFILLVIMSFILSLLILNVYYKASKELDI